MSKRGTGKGKKRSHIKKGANFILRERPSHKPNGLVKKVSSIIVVAIYTKSWQTITITIGGSDLHLVAYYTIEDVIAGKLITPVQNERIMNIELSASMFNLDALRVPPKMMRDSKGHDVIE